MVSDNQLLRDKRRMGDTMLAIFKGYSVALEYSPIRGL
jgi:hypothetical protein